MEFTRRKRSTLEWASPPLLGSLLMMGFSAGRNLIHGRGMGFWMQQGRDIAWSFFFAYLFGLLPSLAYMGLMEAAFARGLDPRSWRAVALSGVLGMLAGACIMFLVSMGRANGADVAYFAGFGSIVGFLLGLIIRVFSRASR